MLKEWVQAIFGILLSLSGIVVIICTEHVALEMISSLEQAKKSTISIDIKANSEHIFDENIVHLSGPIGMGKPLTEPNYNIQVWAVKLKREVQMYQWVEKEANKNNFDNTDDGKKFYYTKEWRDELIDSRQFHSQISHKNPDKFPIESQTQISDIVTIGDYELGMEAKKEFNKFVEITSDTSPNNQSIKMHYHCNDLLHPQVGEVRILFSYAGVKDDEYTIIGKLQKGMIVPYESSRKTKTLLISKGKLSFNEMFEGRISEEQFTQWINRLTTWFLLFFGAYLTSFLLEKKLRRIPFLRGFAPIRSKRFEASLIFSAFLLLVGAKVIAIKIYKFI